MALVMALGIMLVLAIALTTVITFTASGARDAHRVNAGQKANALAEAGVNNASQCCTRTSRNYPPSPETECSVSVVRGRIRRGFRELDADIDNALDVR